jgi:hypothetical protein
MICRDGALLCVDVKNCRDSQLYIHEWIDHGGKTRTVLDSKISTNPSPLLRDDLRVYPSYSQR